MTHTISRRQMLGVSAASVALAAASPMRLARAAAPVILRVSASSPPDKFGGHYLWFKSFEDNLQKVAGDQINIAVVINVDWQNKVPPSVFIG